MNENTLLTDCLELRPIHKDDAKALFAYRKDAESNKYQNWIPSTLDDAYEFIADCAEELEEEGAWFQLIVINSVSGDIIGDIGLFFMDEYQVEIGCTIGKEHQQKGYATEALTTVVDFVFKSLKKHRIIASIDPRNIACSKLLDRLNFRKEAHFVESYYNDGEWLDDVQYGILNKEWDKE